MQLNEVFYKYPHTRSHTTGIPQTIVLGLGFLLDLETYRHFWKKNSRIIERYLFGSSLWHVFPARWDATTFWETIGDVPKGKFSGTVVGRDGPIHLYIAQLGQPMELPQISCVY